MNEAMRAEVREAAREVAAVMKAEVKQLLCHEIGELKAAIKDTVADTRAERDTALQLHTAQCPTKAVVDDLVSQGRGAAKLGKGALALAVFLSGTGGGLVAFFVKWVLARD